MPELIDELIASTATSNNASVKDYQLDLKNEESEYCEKWNASNLLNKLYNVIFKLTYI